VIASTPEVIKLVQLYVDHVRPFAALAGEDKDTAPLFVRADGKQDNRLERHVETFFRAKMNLHINTTTIRRIVDTTAQDLRLRGDLNAVQMDAVLFVQGHSNETSRNYYLQ
jgi:hypothetical protein